MVVNRNRVSKFGSGVIYSDDLPKSVYGACRIWKAKKRLKGVTEGK
jgi:hypothetical protein